MRRVLAIEKPDGTLSTFDSGKVITFTRVADATHGCNPARSSSRLTFLTITTTR
jgi:hypothetical protein